MFKDWLLSTMTLIKFHRRRCFRHFLPFQLSYSPKPSQAWSPWSLSAPPTKKKGDLFLGNKLSSQVKLLDGSPMSFSSQAEESRLKR